METLSHLWQHWSIEILVAIILVFIGLLKGAFAALLTSLFSPIKINGDWETQLDRGSGLARHEDVKLKQCIHRVWGQATSTDGRHFKLNGSISGDRVCLVYRAKRPSTDCGANLLKVMAHGKSMKGFEIGIDLDTDQPQTYKYEWARKP